MQPKHFPKNIKNDCCLLITDDVDTKPQQETGLNVTFVGTVENLGQMYRKLGPWCYRRVICLRLKHRLPHYLSTVPAEHVNSLHT